jgi:hypothetical protein
MASTVAFTVILSFTTIGFGVGAELAAFAPDPMLDMMTAAATNAAAKIFFTVFSFSSLGLVPHCKLAF